MCLEGFSAADPSEESGEEIQRDTPRGGLEFLKIFEEFKHWATYPRCRLELEITGTIRKIKTSSVVGQERSEERFNEINVK